MIALAVMWVPALAALVTTLAFRDSFRDYGWAIGRWKWLGLAYIATFFYAAAPFLLAVATGNGALTMQWWPMAAGHLGLPATPALGFLMLATVNVLFAMISALGEEIGWRGFLVQTLAKRFGFRQIVVISWAVWLSFHLPALLAGAYGNPALPRAVAIANFAIMLVPLTVLMTWLRLRSGSLWPCVLAHAVHNAVIGEMFGSAIVPDAWTPWLVGEFGLLTPITAALAVGLLLWATRDRAAAGGMRPVAA